MTFTKVPHIKRLPWRVSTYEHQYRRILHAESPVPAKGVWAIRPGAFGWVPKILFVLVKENVRLHPPPEGPLRDDLYLPHYCGSASLYPV